MLEDTTAGMERPKGAPRQSSSLAKSNGAFERKNDPSIVNKFHGRFKKRENGNGRGSQSDFSNRRPFPQKSRSALDKRPRQRGCVGYRQRETVAETEGVEPESATPQHGIPKKVIANHLWNFQYTRRENVVGSTRQPRARRPRITYNKERYLQANCQFVVKDSGDYTLQAHDPDALVDWDLVEQVRTFCHEQTTCPICLQPPAAGKITKCGHVYCWACILHYIDLDDRTWRKCPICFESIHKSDLRSVRVLRKVEQKVGDTITLQLMKRERSSTHAVPLAHWQDRDGCPYNIDDEINTEYAKVLVASAQQIQMTVIEEERQALEMHMASAEPSEVCFIESAMKLLNERENSLLDRAKVTEENSQLMDQLEGASSADDSGDGNGSRDKGARAKTVAASPPTAPLPKNVSFDGSKIRKQYADAFDELEDEEEETGDLSDHEKLWDNDEDEESVDSVPFSTSPSVHSQGSVASEDGSMSPPADDGLTFLPPELLQEATLTAEEAIEQLALPAHLSNDAEMPRKRGNLSKSAFYFYQASDGQQIYLHSVNARCIDHQYGSLENGPPTITATIVEKDITFMTENLRKRLRYLSHLPLTCEFQVVEVKLQPPVVSKETLNYFSKDLKKRAQHRLKVMREDKRQARKQHDAERKSYGQYVTDPEQRLPLNNPEDFPAPVSDVEERRRQSSLSDTASLSSPPNPSPLDSELNANATDFVPRPKTDSNPPDIQCSWAAAVKSKKQPVASAWGISNGSPAAAATPVPSHRVDSEESDNEDRVPVPAFQDSFSIDISVALESSKQNNGGQGSGKAGKKKKKPTLLYSTSMQRR